MSDSESADEFARIPLRVRREKKESWDDYLDDPETPVKQRSELIRLAVNQFIDSSESDNHSGDITGELQHEFDEVTSRLDQIERQLSAIESSLAQNSEFTRLKLKIYNTLPMINPNVPYDLRAGRISPPWDEEKGTVGYIADQADEAENEVRDALEVLRIERDDVHKRSNPEPVIYYRDKPHRLMDNDVELVHEDDAAGIRLYADPDRDINDES